jgi:hypothetical protein
VGGGDAPVTVEKLTSKHLNAKLIRIDHSLTKLRTKNAEMGETTQPG